MCGSALIEAVASAAESRGGGAAWPDSRPRSPSVNAASTACDIWKHYTRILIQYWSGLSTYFRVNDHPKSLVTIARLIIICFYPLSLRLSSRAERFHNVGWVPAAAPCTGAKEAKFGITTSLLNFRLQPSIKNRLRQHWIDRCSPWHLCDCDITVRYRWHR